MIIRTATEYSFTIKLVSPLDNENSPSVHQSGKLFAEWFNNYTCRPFANAFIATLLNINSEQWEPIIENRISCFNNIKKAKKTLKQFNWDKIDDKVVMEIINLLPSRKE